MNRNDCSDDFSIMTFMPPSSSTLQGQVIYEGMFIWQVLGTRPVVPNQRSDRLEIATTPEQTMIFDGFDWFVKKGPIFLFSLDDGTR